MNLARNLQIRITKFVTVSVKRNIRLRDVFRNSKYEIRHEGAFRFFDFGFVFPGGNR